MQSNDVRAIGICGMGGIGKTTTAKAFYNKYSNKFDISCFTEVVKQCSEGVGPLLPLLNQLLIKLLRRKDYKVPDVENGIRKLKQILSSKKALIVLDDLDQSSYSELLVRLCKSFSDGSRIIITTTDTNLLNQLKVDISEVSVYMVKKLGQNDSSELFSYHAFKKPTPPEMFRELTVSFVTYAGGVPLALKVLGSSLCGRTDVSFWKAKLQKVRKIPEKEIQKILELSYDELDRTEKAIFLDIAFFFVGKDKDDAVHIFKSCDFYPDVGIPILVERCLLTIDEDNKFKMHNLIQDLGRELGKSRGLFWRGAPEDMLKLKGKNKIEGLILDMSTQRQITTEIFEKLSNLRLLEINDAQDIKGNFKNLFCELRSIRWRGCPMTHLSSSFLPRKLVSLDVSSSKLQTLWKSPRAITQLTNLGHLNLARCYKLKLLPDQLGDINGLRMLDASHTAIEKLPDSISHLKSLVKLKLDGCRKLRELPEQFGNMEGLRTFDATYCAIRQLPDSFAGLINLVELNFYGCKKLKKLPEQFGNMEGLRLFDASFSAIEQLPDSFGRLINLADLQLSDCKNLTSISNCVWRLKFLRVLNVKYCSMLERLPEQLGKMQCLEEVIASGTAIEELPDSIGLLSKLQKLVVNNKLKYVPNSIWNLTSLAELRLIQKDTFKIDLPETVNNTKLECLSLRCNIRLWLPLIQSFSCLNTLTLMDEGQSVSSAKLTSLSKLSNLQYLTLYNCTSIGSSFPELPLNLTELSLFNHATLEQLPNLSTLKRLRKLDIGGCTSLQSLPPLPPHLQILKVCECTSLQDVPDLSMLKELETSSFIGCTNLKLRTLQETFPKVRPVLSSFRADLPNGEVVEWFSYKSSGSIVSFEAPPIFGDNFSGVSLWVFYTSCESRDTSYYTLEAVITNKTQGIENKYYMDNWIYLVI